ncbi:9254_t:CDS:1, partial [Acaulospora morrowiae]
MYPEITSLLSYYIVFYLSYSIGSNRQFFSLHGKFHLLNMSDTEHNNSPNHISSQNNTANNQPTSFLEDLNTAWLPFHENENLPTSIYKGNNTLLSDDRLLMLQIIPGISLS